MKTTLYLLTLFVFNCVHAQFDFPDLKYQEIDNSYLDGTVGYPTTGMFDLLNKPCSSLKTCFFDDTYTLIGTLTFRDNSAVAFYYTEGPSDDPTFTAVYNGKVILEEPGNTMHIKQGILYIEGSANAYFDKKRKFQFLNGEYKEVNQPFYAINEAGNLNYAITIYESEAFTKKVASLPKGYQIEIVLGKTTGEYNDLEAVLIKSEFGLLGWLNFREISIAEPLIDGFYYQGD